MGRHGHFLSWLTLIPGKATWAVALSAPYDSSGKAGLDAKVCGLGKGEYGWSTGSWVNVTNVTAKDKTFKHILMTLPTLKLTFKSILTAYPVGS